MHNFFVVVLDGVGIGELPDAADYNDSGSNTLCNIAKRIGGLNLPNLEKLGLGNIDNISGIKKMKIHLPLSGKWQKYQKVKILQLGIGK
jgi:phosphopentomutase